MTENEALDSLNNLHYKIVHTSFCNKVYESEIEALCMAKDALEEIQRYRAIGTIEELEEAKIQYDNINAAAKKVALIGLCGFEAAKEALVSEIKRNKEEEKNKFFNFDSPVARIDEKSYNKAIDDFAEAIRGIYYKYPIGTDADTNEPLYGHEDGTWHSLIDDVAERMRKENSMGEWSPFTLSEFEWEVLKLYIKHGHGDVKLYNTSFFTSSLTDETVCMTLSEFADKAVDYDDFPWMYKDKQALEKMKGGAV